MLPPEQPLVLGQEGGKAAGEQTLDGPRVSPREAVSIRGSELGVATSVHGKLFSHDSCSYFVNPNLAEGSAGVG